MNSAAAMAIELCACGKSEAEMPKGKMPEMRWQVMKLCSSDIKFLVDNNIIELSKIVQTKELRNRRSCHEE